MEPPVQFFFDQQQKEEEWSATSESETEAESSASDEPMIFESPVPHARRPESLILDESICVRRSCGKPRVPSYYHCEAHMPRPIKRKTPPTTDSEGNPLPKRPRGRPPRDNPMPILPKKKPMGRPRKNPPPVADATPPPKVEDAPSEPEPKPKTTKKKRAIVPSKKTKTKKKKAEIVAEETRLIQRHFRRWHKKRAAKKSDPPPSDSESDVEDEDSHEQVAPHLLAGMLFGEYWTLTYSRVASAKIHERCVTYNTTTEIKSTRDSWDARIMVRLPGSNALLALRLRVPSVASSERIRHRRATEDGAVHVGRHVRGVFLPMGHLTNEDIDVASRTLRHANTKGIVPEGEYVLEGWVTETTLTERGLMCCPCAQRDFRSMWQEMRMPNTAILRAEVYTCNEEGCVFQWCELCCAKRRRAPGIDCPRHGTTYVDVAAGTTIDKPAVNFAPSPPASPYEPDIVLTKRETTVATTTTTVYEYIDLNELMSDDEEEKK
jgi:hypothetical protein